MLSQRQQEDAGAAEHIGEGVDLGGLITARGTDCLRLGPPLPLGEIVAVAPQGDGGGLKAGAGPFTSQGKRKIKP